MILIRPTNLYWIICLLLFCSACEKETITVTDNEAPQINNTPQIKIENYVNRLFIDLIGREPLDSEMAEEVEALKNNSLDLASRKALIDKLQTSTDPVDGDGSYTAAYHSYLYNLAKIRCIEGASDAVINEFIDGAQTPADEARLQNILDSQAKMLNGEITYDEMLAYMIYNRVYDEINMNSFNFVNATFENLLWRFPTDAELTEGYRMVEYNVSSNLFGQTGQNKTDYVNILAGSREMFEGLIIWAYQQLLSRRPSTEETAVLLEDFFEHRNIRLVQRSIMTSDEYANF